MNNMNENPLEAGGAQVDRRTRRTKRALRQGLAVLLLQKSLKDISVRELTDSVDLHRGTFYAHYRDIYDLYASIESEIVEEVDGILDKFLPETIEAEPFPIILALIEYIYENADVCRMLFSQNGDMTFVERLADIVRSRCLSDWIDLYSGDQQVQRDYYGCYVISGCIAILRRWVESGTEQPPQEIAAIIEQMAVPGVEQLKRTDGTR